MGTRALTPPATSRLLERVTGRAEVRPVAAVVVALGALLLAADVGPNPVILKLPVPGERGVHLADVAGVALVVLGVVMLWRAPPRVPRTPR